MKIIDEILPKVKAEVRLDKDNKTLWIKTDTLDGYGRIIVEDGSNWCRVFYEDKDEPNSSEKPNNCEPQTDCYVSDLCKHYGDKQICGRCRSRNLFCETEPQPKDEPQTDAYDSAKFSHNCIGMCENPRTYMAKVEDKPQTDVYDYKGNGTWERSE